MVSGAACDGTTVWDTSNVRTSKSPTIRLVAKKAILAHRAIMQRPIAENTVQGNQMLVSIPWAEMRETHRALRPDGRCEAVDAGFGRSTSSLRKRSGCNAFKLHGTTTHAGRRVILDESGAPEKIRTPDPQIRSLVLYPAELPVHA